MTRLLELIKRCRPSEKRQSFAYIRHRETPKRRCFPDGIVDFVPLSYVSRS